MEQLRKIAAPLAAINVGVNIKRARDVYREDICSLLTFWLKELVHGQARFFDNISDGDAIVRTIVCEELCASRKLRTSAQLSEIFAHEDYMDEDFAGTATTTIPMGTNNLEEDIDMLYADVNDKEPEQEDSTTNLDSASIDWYPAAMINEFQLLRTEELMIWDEFMANSNGKGKNLGAPAGKKIAREVGPSVMQQEFERRLRLDYLLISDVKLWKEMRVALRELYITSLICDSSFRKVLG